jgi:hypothetical protein
LFVFPYSDVKVVGKNTNNGTKKEKSCGNTAGSVADWKIVFEILKND